MLESGWIMRAALWAFIVCAGLACSRRSLQEDAAGSGMIGMDGAPDPTDGGLRPPDAIIQVPDARVPTGTCNSRTSTVGSRPRSQILLVLDQSIAGDRAGWDSVKAAIVDQINANPFAIDWGLYVFPKEGPACGASTISAGADLPLGMNGGSHLIAHLAAAAVDGNGSPTAAAIAAGAAYLGTLGNQSSRYLMLVTDGAPTCAGTIGALSDDPIRAHHDAVDAITAALRAGIPTIVVAPSTTTDVADVGSLNVLAVTGGHLRLNDRINFYTETTLPEAFRFIGDSGSCTFPLQDTPPVPDAVTVTLNGAIVPRDRSQMSGWDYTSPDTKKIELHGSWCQMVFASPEFRLEIVYNCPLL